VRPPRPLSRRPERPGGRADPASAIPAPPLAPARAPVLEVPLGTLLLAAVVAGGAALRLAGLDAFSLTVREAAQAFPAWAAAQGVRPPGWAADATSVLTAYLFRAGADGDGWARLVSALAGALLVPTVYLLARPGGRGVAFLAAALVAFSPPALAASRTALPGALGGLLAVLLGAALLRAWQRPQPASLLAVGQAAGLCLGTDAVGMTGLLACVLFLATAAWADESAWAAARASLRRWAWALALGLAPGVLLSAVHWGAGAQSALAAPRLWADLFALPRADSPALPLVSLLAYDWPLTLLGLGGAALLLGRIWRQGGLAALAPWERLALCWLAPALLLVLAGTRVHEGALLAVVIPLACLGARAVAWGLDCLPWADLRRSWPLTVLAVACLGAMGILWTLWSRPFARVSAAEAWGAWLAAVALTWGVWLGWRWWRAGMAPALALAVAGLAVAFWPHSLWAVGFHGGAEPLLGARYTFGAGQIERSLPQAPTPEMPLALSPAAADLLGWQFRHLPLSVGDPPPQSSVYIAIAGEATPRGFSLHGGPTAVARDWRWDSDGLRFWRWLLLREPYGPSRDLSVQVMVRTP